MFRTRHGACCLGRDGPVPYGYGTTSPRTCSCTISILAIVGSRPGAGWLPALSKTYRNLTALPVASWNQGTKTNVISPSPMRWWMTNFLACLTCLRHFCDSLKQFLPKYFNLAFRISFAVEYITDRSSGVLLLWLITVSVRFSPMAIRLVCLM